MFPRRSELPRSEKQESPREKTKWYHQAVNICFCCCCCLTNVVSYPVLKVYQGIRKCLWNRPVVTQSFRMTIGCKQPRCCHAQYKVKCIFILCFGYIKVNTSKDENISVLPKVKNICNSKSETYNYVK